MESTRFIIPPALTRIIKTQTKSIRASLISLTILSMVPYI